MFKNNGQTLENIDKIWIQVKFNGNQFLESAFFSTSEDHKVEKPSPELRPLSPSIQRSNIKLK